ncbi:MAG: NAD-dependent epimerase/dehydratase family protein [Burkholderiales bacterium]|nr:NAD-dependent epimerase/dehydratase family protein [Burkholderiales bacterium]
MPGTTPKCVLVTGATGFLGGNVLKALMAQPKVEVVAACRSCAKLPAAFKGEVRIGDLLNPAYRRDVVQGVDVICHAASWAAMWNHAKLERARFFEPNIDLIEQSIRHGVKRFIQASTIAIGEVHHDGSAHDDRSSTRHTGFWPHLDRLIDLDHHMRANSQRGTQMVTLRLGNFIGKGNRLGLLPALVPRLRTYLVPWLAGGRKRMPLVADTDLGMGFALAAVVDGLDGYESFNICGSQFPTMREVIEFIAAETGFLQPLYSVPYPAGYAFGWLMEKLHPILPGSSPFLTRSIVHLSEDWLCPNDYAQQKLGYVAQKDWRTAVREHLADLGAQGYPWPRLAQAS